MGHRRAGNVRAGTGAHEAGRRVHRRRVHATRKRPRVSVPGRAHPRARKDKPQVQRSGDASRCHRRQGVGLDPRRASGRAAGTPPHRRTLPAKRCCREGLLPRSLRLLWLQGANVLRSMRVRQGFSRHSICPTNVSSRSLPQGKDNSLANVYGSGRLLHKRLRQAAVPDGRGHVARVLLAPWRGR